MAFENLKKEGIKTLLEKLKTFLESKYQQIASAVKSVNGNEPDADGDITLVSVPYAQNLESESSKRISDTFIERTAGGVISVHTGDAWLMGIKGNNSHEGFVPESLEMTVTATSDITAELDRDTFVDVVSESGTLTFTYTSAWSADPSNYGVTVSGTPASGDTITIVYVKEERGTITVADPSSFTATGWNLFNYTAGYARVLKYAFGYRVDGTYTALEFSATLEGTRTEVTVTDGSFDIPTDGYIWVTGGDPSDTAIYMTWEDWTEAHAGDFEEYTESTVNLATVMAAKFPHGLLKAGTVVDEIDLNLAQAIVRVERLEYNSTNLATAKDSGREYEYDENYIYLAKASAVVSSITIDGAFIASDHGIEFFTGTFVGPEAETLYGVNLKNKLEREVLTISPQDLSTAQKNQARQNIGALGSGDIANNLTTTTSGKALDARQGKALNDKVEKRAITNYSISAGATKEIPLDSGSRYFIIVNSSVATVKELIIASTSNAGGVQVVRAINATNLAIDTGTENKLKLTNNATNSAVAYVEKLQ